MNNKLYILIVIVLVLAVGYYFFYPMNKEVDVEVTTNTPPTANSKMSFFITSANPGRGGDLGGLSGADNYCKTLAESAGISGKNWAAYLSTRDMGGVKGVNAKERIGTGPWYNFKGELVANNVEELHANNFLNKQTALNEKGEMVNGRGDTPNIHDILTGSTELGVASTSVTDTNCNNWTSAETGSAVVGHHDRVGRDETVPMKSWNSSHLTRGCSLENFKTTGGGGLFYCFAK